MSFIYRTLVGWLSLGRSFACSFGRGLRGPAYGSRQRLRLSNQCHQSTSSRRFCASAGANSSVNWPLRSAT